MDLELLMIFSFVLTICLIVFPFAFAIHRRNIQHEERKLELKAKVAEANKGGPGIDPDAYRKLEERVRVLERIATDDKVELARQIEHLRDIHEIDALTEKRETAR